ncbi:MAG: glycosyltransferase family 39 protein [Planctomycetes bacterium]|nr:glycosyltransferase family 39 protein [Planctomycetota bacterium]
MAQIRNPTQSRWQNQAGDTDSKTLRLDSALVFIFTIAVAIASLPHRSGYPIADAVEYLKNAARAEGGQAMIQNTARPFFFSAFLVPIFRAVRVFGSTDGREAVAVATPIMLMIAGLAAVATYRFVEKLAGAPAALGAALFLAANRVYQFWAPVVATDVPCAACVACAFAIVLRPPNWKNSLMAGALMGTAILFKYQAMMIVGLMLIGMPFLWRRDVGRRHWYYLMLVIAGVCAGLLVQCILDWLGDRGFGQTLLNYVRANFIYPYGQRLAPILQKIMGKEGFRDWFQTILGGVPVDEDKRDQIAKLNPEFLINQPYSYYWRQLPQFLTWLEFGLGCLGVAALVRRRPRGWWYPIFILFACIVMLNIKGTKEWRLYVSVSPFVFAMIGIGFSAAILWISRLSPRLAAFAAALCLAPDLISMLGGVPLQTRLSRIPQIRPLLMYDARTPVKIVDRKPVLKGWRPWQIIPECTNPADYGGYERAAHWMNQNAAAGSRVSATWFWQFHFRLRPDIFLVEPLIEIDDKYRDLPESKKQIVRDYLHSLDYFASHLQALVNAPELLELVDREFEIASVFENTIYDETLNSIFIFKKRARPGGEPWFTRVLAGPEAEKTVSEADPAKQIVFYESTADARRPVVEVIDAGLDPEQLAAGRLTARIVWRVPKDNISSGHDLTLQLRARNGALAVVDSTGYKLGFDSVPKELWKPGTVIIQRIPLRPARDIFDFARANQPNEAINISLYLQLIRAAPEGTHYPLPDVERFSRLRDPDTNAVLIGSTVVVQ